MNKTWFIDIDGTLVKHLENKEIDEGMHEELLPYAVEFLEGLEERGDCIILTTARLEEHRQVTIQTLTNFKIPYHQIIFGVGSQERILINDIKPKGSGNSGRQHSLPTAYAINVKRNVGFADILCYNFNRPIQNQKDYAWELI